MTPVPTPTLQETARPDIDPSALLAEANAYAQRRFRDMLAAKSYSDPEAAETRAYVMAERVVDDLLGQVQWEASKAAMDELQADDEHGPLFPEGVIEGQPEFNGSFR